MPNLLVTSVLIIRPQKRMPFGILFSMRQDFMLLARRARRELTVSALVLRGLEGRCKILLRRTLSEGECRIASENPGWILLRSRTLSSGAQSPLAQILQNIEKRKKGCRSASLFPFLDATRFELAASASRTQRSTKLSHASMLFCSKNHYKSILLQSQAYK